MFQEQEVQVLPYIPQAVKMHIAKTYVETMLSEDNIVNKYYAAEWSVILGIVEHCTNLNINGDSFEKFMSSGLWEELTYKIYNYYELLDEIKIIMEALSSKETFEATLVALSEKLSGKIVEFIDKISSLDLSKEGIANLVSSLKGEMDGFGEKFPENGITETKSRKKKVSTDKKE